MLYDNPNLAPREVYGDTMYATCPSCGIEMGLYIDTSCGLPNELRAECVCGMRPVWGLDWTTPHVQGTQYLRDDA